MSQALLVSGDWTVSSNIIVDDVMRERERERSTCERLSRERERETREREREREHLAAHWPLSILSGTL